MNESVNSSAYTLRNSPCPTAQTSTNMPEQRDLVILTVVPEETRAVIQRLEAYPGYVKEPVVGSKRIFYRGQLPSGGGKSISAVCTQLPDQSNLPAMAASLEVMRLFRPRWIVIVGIGGSIREEVRLCDVVVATLVYYYDRRAETPNGRQFRMDPYRIDALLKTRLEDMRTQLGDHLKSSDKSDETFQIHLDPIGSGEAVVKDVKSEVRLGLSSVNDKTAAVETEAAGLARADYEAELNEGPKLEGWLVFRGISDGADPGKKDFYRKKASENAMSALEQFLPFLLFGNEMGRTKSED